MNINNETVNGVLKHHHQKETSSARQLNMGIVNTKYKVPKYNERLTAYTLTYI